jgi:hypothetical protein
MAAKIINGTRYILRLDDVLRKDSLKFEYNLYYILKEIWMNIDINEAIRVSYYISLSNILKNSFECKNIEKCAKPIFNYLTDLCSNGLYELNEDVLFDFYNIDDWDEEEKNEINLNDYIKYEDWWLQFKAIYYKLEEIIKNNKLNL